MSFKGPRHENLAVLGQFCANIITYCLYPHTKCSGIAMREISNKFYPGELTKIIFCVCVISEDMASKLEKIGPIFFQVSIHFHPCLHRGQTREICEKQENCFKGKVVTFTVQSLILYQYPADLLTFLEVY